MGRRPVTCSDQTPPGSLQQRFPLIQADPCAGRTLQPTRCVGRTLQPTVVRCLNVD